MKYIGDPFSNPIDAKFAVTFTFSPDFSNAHVVQ